MNVTATQRWGARFGVLALLSGSVVCAVVSPAAADEFDPSNTAPTAEITTGNPMAAVTPTSTGSSDQTIAVSVGDVDLLQDLDTVTLCLHTAAVANCSTPNPQTNVLITWTRSTNTFAMTPVDGLTTWNLQPSTSNYNASNTSMAMSFVFKVGAVATNTTWTAVATATDVSAAAGTDTAASLMPVSYFSYVKTQRASQDFGNVAAAGSQVAANISDGTVVSNGESDISISQAAAFEMTAPTSYTATIAAGTPADAPGSGAVAVDCRASATYDNTNAIRVTNSPQVLESGVTATGTVEDGIDTLVNSCRLTSGGGLPIGTYSSTMVIGIGAP